MQLQPWLFTLLLILGSSLGASLTWFLCHISSQTTRIRHRERCKALLKSSVELEACCARLEEEIEKLRCSEAGALRREALLKAEQKSAVDREQLLRETEFRLLQGFQSASLQILKKSEENGAGNTPTARVKSGNKGVPFDQDADRPAATIREQVASDMHEVGSVNVPASSSDAAVSSRE
tara:strand:- start:381 stop:917 length:537 start_codon:yes stop_codon:yes gene_type:complete